jgi:energy-coupling factor transporter ATP-binding protein EcfA2
MPNPTTIKEINVEQLFGYYSYKLCETNSQKDLSKLMIFYGDNGSGKTTILKLIFYLLSCIDKKGHKTALARYKFKRFSVLFTNGVEIGASRPRSKLGSYTYYIKKNNQSYLKVLLKTSGRDNSIQLEETSKANIIFHKIIDHIENMNIRLFYLADNRKTMDTLPPSLVEEDDYEFRRNVLFHSRDELKRYEEQMALGERGIILNYKMRELADWIRKHVILSSRVGEENTISVYTRIVKRVTNSEDKTLKDLNQLVSTFNQLTKRSREYARIGLITSLEYKGITGALKKIRGKKVNLIYKIIEPFMEGLKARLDALQELKDTISMLIKTVNEHFIDKQIGYDMSHGFKVTHLKTGEDIEFDNLSSGEKQFLLLISNTITAKEKASIFIIDEPEISLNIKWQRELIRTLLEFSRHNNVQFLIATHSIELLTGYSNNVIRLKS